MKIPDISIEFLAEWWNKGFRLDKLKLENCHSEHSIQNGFAVLGVGIVLSVVIKSLGIFLLSSNTHLDQAVAFPFHACLFGGSALFFSLILHLFLYALRLRTEFNLTVTVVCYVFAAILPWLTFFSFEQMEEAIRLYLSRGDPGLPYFTAATLSLLFAEKATLFAKARILVLLILEGFIVIWYGWHLHRLLTQCSLPSRSFIRILIAIVLSLGLHFLLVRFYFGRIFWRLTGALLS